MAWPGVSTTVFIAATILVGALVTLLWAAPFFKKSYLDILEVLEEAGQGEAKPPEAKSE